MKNLLNCLSIFIVIIFLLTISGCLHKKKPSEKIYEVLERVVKLEESFEKQQEPLVTFEKEEENLYDKIVNLSTEEQEEIEKLSNQALLLLDKRKVHMEKEQKSLKASEKEFEKVKEFLKELEEKEVADTAKDLYQTMMDRYRAHDILYKEYMKSLKHDRELYELFKQENVSLDQLEVKVKELNQTYQGIFEANETFNKNTEKYNQKKILFYKKAEIKIEEN